MELITSKKQLKKFFDVELSRIKKNCKGIKLHSPFIIYEEQIIYKILYYLRKAEYHTNTNHYLRGMYYRFKLLRYETKHTIFIPLNKVDIGLNIAHIGTIIINDNATIGKNLKIYPGVVIGNNEFKDHVKCPIIGDNVYIGTGAKIFGGLTIADNCIVAANSVVTKSIKQKNSIVGGAPARLIKKNNYYNDTKNIE